ncbi:ABC transporter permease [Brevibacillus sp. H7]|uniref:COG1470 family protein n=1 Tax=Brevibacillus sp. H7 TaxID=3349138 RepID=UPI00380B00FD
MGFTIGDNLVPDGNGGYISVGHFRTSPQPTGEVKTDKTEYQVNDNVTIMPKASDYSYYDRGVLIWNLSVINMTTGDGYQQILANKTFKDTSGYIPQVDDDNDPPAPPFHWNQTFTYRPEKPGIYEVSLTITDLHHRSRQGSSSISVSTPYTYQFTVGDVEPPPDDGGGDPGPTCAISSTNTKLDIRIEEENHDRELSAEASGGGTISVEKYAHLILSATKDGTYTMNGTAQLMPGSGSNRKIGIADAPGSGTFTIKYESDDKSECWVKTFEIETDPSSPRCPIVELEDSVVSSSETIEITAGEVLNFHSTYRTADTTTEAAEVGWEVTKPDGTKLLLPVREEENRKGGYTWKPYNSSHLTLPTSGFPPAYTVAFDQPGAAYQLRLVFTATLFQDMNCNWAIQIKVRDSSCTIDEQDAITFKVYGEPPSAYPPSGASVNSDLREDIYFHAFTPVSNGYDTHMSFTASVTGSWYVELNGKKVSLGGQVAAHDRFHLILPPNIDGEIGQVVELLFISSNGCERSIYFTLLSDRKCFDFSLTTATSGEIMNVRRSEILHLEPSDLINGQKIELFTGILTEFSLYIYDEQTGQYSRKYNGKTLSSSSDDHKHHDIVIPKDPTTGQAVQGLYKVSVFEEGFADCNGVFFIQMGPTSGGAGENLLIVKSSFAISPNQPQQAGSDATITFEVKNAGKLTHDTKLAVRWESVATATIMDVKAFMPGETRKITVPTKYPTASENFIANINPNKDLPANETVWTDNRAEWPVSITGATSEVGGDIDAGQMKLNVYDSDNRLLTSTADGVWEREPARIEVIIDQAKIDAAFVLIDAAINKAIGDRKTEFLNKYPSPDYENVEVTPSPLDWRSKTSPQTQWPASVELSVRGPGGNKAYPLNPKAQIQSVLYTDTSVPTQTTWQLRLQGQSYEVTASEFSIQVPYTVQFAVSYEKCEMKSPGVDPDSGEQLPPEKTCTPGTDSDNISGTFAIQVKGDQTRFEVFEPNAKGMLQHTAEWAEYHGRDRYRSSQPNDYYAGERILTRVLLEPRHRHPFSGKYPTVAAAQAWISEIGQRNTLLQSVLSLKQSSPLIWNGPHYQVPKLGSRETGVDTPFMGDKQRGFKKDSSYAVNFSVQFGFGVSKGFLFPDKTVLAGHEPADYRTPFRIIANAWERQGIRNHTTR